MENMEKPYTECYVFDDPTNVYDLTGWNPVEKLYRLENDRGRKRFMRYFEFCPISVAHEEEIEAGDDGKIYTVQQLVDAGGSLKWKRPAWASGGHGGATEATSQAGGPEARAPRPKPKESQAKGHGGATADSGAAAEAKAKVRGLLEPCKSREEIANVGMVYLGEDAGVLLSKYMHLDNGRFRMTIGNRMVGVYKKNGGF